MDLQWRRYELRLIHPFKIARETQTLNPVILVGIRKGDKIGWGEACPGDYYGDDLQKIVSCFEAEKKNELPESTDLIKYCVGLRQEYPDSPSARAALEIALFDLYAQATYEPIYKYLNIPSHTPPQSSFTIGIDQPDMIAKKIREASDYPLLKVKLGGGNDEDIISTIRKYTDKILRVDANCGWTKEEAARKSEWLAKENVEFIEQPLRGDDMEGFTWLKSRSALPVMLDESIQCFADLEKFAEAAHGVNIKLMKMGGLFESLDVISGARRFGWKIMIGCLIESAISITAACHLSPLVDYLDLDGNLLIKNDPCEGVHAHGGKIALPTGPGLGARPKDWEEWWKK